MSLTSWPVLTALLVAIPIVLRVIALGIVPGNRKPSSGMAWLLLIMIQPYVGLFAFSLFGRTALGRRRHGRQQRADAAIRQAMSVPEAVPEPEPAGSMASTWVDGVVRLNQHLGALPMLAGNQLEFLPGYRATIAAMAHEVEAAESWVHVEFYITAWDEVTDPLLGAMARAAERGVEVRLLFDHLGSRGLPSYRELLRRLGDTRIQWRAMLPIRPLQRRWRRPDLRNHRKLVVVDGLVGFAGSLNLTEPGYNKPKNHRLGREWVELMVRVEGPAVAALNAVFAGDWYAETGEIADLALPGPAQSVTPAATGSAPAGQVVAPVQVVPSGPGYPAENNLRMFNSLLYGARRRISITSPYFVPDESLLSAVTTAAQRGVAVELFVSEVSDQFMVGHAQASYYRALLEAGVVIYRYPAPYVLHAKHLTIDDDVAVIGSSNMDMRSFSLNYELSLMLRGVEPVTALRQIEDEYRRLSAPLGPEEWAQRPARLRYVDNVMRLTAALQ